MVPAGGYGSGGTPAVGPNGHARRRFSSRPALARTHEALGERDLRGRHARSRRPRESLMAWGLRSGKGIARTPAGSSSVSQRTKVHGPIQLPSRRSPPTRRSLCHQRSPRFEAGGTVAGCRIMTALVGSRSRYGPPGAEGRDAPGRYNSRQIVSLHKAPSLLEEVVDAVREWGLGTTAPPLPWESSLNAGRRPCRSGGAHTRVGCQAAQIDSK